MKPVLAIPNLASLPSLYELVTSLKAVIKTEEKKRYRVQGEHHLPLPAPQLHTASQCPWLLPPHLPPRVGGSQSLVFRSLLFSAYTHSLGDHVPFHGLEPHRFAHDTQCVGLTQLSPSVNPKSYIHVPVQHLRLDV